ncbi:auxin-responsive protein IAA1-like [Prunus yedoensis var. nudiflora]|uniref:Auxin-responsive protein n=1 Tax=Prunus yedoensis var. nudiflora TaxID=2094558 RepID=A0A314XWJ3_PRUYE|nr:auxin-responsive protein IAA1-like [Prunus yedoensis var. nudiflora]
MNMPPEAVDDDDVNKSMDFKDTELTLGLPGRPRHCSSSAADHFFGGIKSSSCSMKRGFMETVDQSIGLESSTSCEPRSQIKVDGKLEAHYNNYSSSSSSGRTTTAVKSPAAKARVVGWPPVRSLRQKALVESKSTYVKVGADGAPYLRKLDLDMYKSYHELLRALDQMFPSFTTSGKYVEDTTSNQEQLMKSAVKGMDEYIVVTYEDKDGDWMLVGDVPWKLFIESCKRIRLMKSSEAVGIAPRTSQVLTQ